jgi:hypothetical protein
MATVICQFQCSHHFSRLELRSGTLAPLSILPTHCFDKAMYLTLSTVSNIFPDGIAKSSNFGVSGNENIPTRSCLFADVCQSPRY